MSSEIKSINIHNPIYYHREYKNDVIKEPKEACENTWINTCQRIGFAALPFFSLYKPLSFPLSLAMGGLRAYTSITQLLETIKSGNAKNIPFAMIQTSVSVAALAGTIFAHPLGMLISTGNDLILEAVKLTHNLQAGDYKKAAENCLGIINNSLYLAIFIHGGLELSIASLAMQILIGLYHSQAEFRNGHYIEGVGHLLMSMVRGNQLTEQTKMLQTRWSIESAKKSKEKEQGLQKNITTKKQKGSNDRKCLSQLASIKNRNNTEHLKLLNSVKSENDQELIDILIKYGNNSDGLPILHYTIKMQDEKAVELLLNHGADPKALSMPLSAIFSYQNNHQYYPFLSPILPLEFAAITGNTKIMQLLISSGADVNQKSLGKLEYQESWPGNVDHLGSPLFFAAREGHDDAIRFLLDNGALVQPPSTAQDDPLRIATEKGFINILYAFKQKGVDVRSYATEEPYLLHTASYMGRDKIVEFLLDEGVYVDIHRHGGHTSLMHAKGSCAEILLTRGANPNAKNYNGWDPLYFSAFNGDIVASKALIKSGANINALRGDHGTPFHAACRSWYEGRESPYEYLHFLLNNGADINARSNGKTVLSEAKLNNRQGLVNWLIAHGARE